MSEFTTITRDIILTVFRCWDCGRWWARERDMGGQCPICAQKRIEGCLEDQAKLERTIAALKGALTRAKGKP